MNGAGWFTIGTLATWIGWAIAFRTVWQAFRLLSGTPGIDRHETLRKVASTALVAAMLLLAGSALVRATAGYPDSTWRLPLVWWVMPFSAWLAFVSLAIALYQGALALGTPDPIQQRRYGLYAFGWYIAMVFGLSLYRGDREAKVTILKGGVPFDPLTGASLVLLAIGFIAAVTFISRAAQSHRVARAAASQLALIAGSALFGLPLLYLLVTSFKEDRDMSSANGIVWVPRVQRTIPYKDPINPLFETSYNGQTVEATVTERLPDRLKLDIVKPFSLRGIAIERKLDRLREVPKNAPLVAFQSEGVRATGMVVEDLEDGRKRVRFLEPPALKGQERIFLPTELEPIRDVGPRWQNYSEALSFLPPETVYGLAFLRNTLIVALLSVIGTILSSSLAAYAFARMRFPGREVIFAMFLATMMLPGAVTMLPQFLIFRNLGWIDTLLPLWVPAFFGSAFNIFMLRQFFRTIPMELEDAARIDGCGYGRTFWSVMLPQIKPALAVIGIWTFLGAWNNFMGPLIYINSVEKAPISYALQLYMGDRSGEPGLLMAFVTMTIIPILLLFFVAQRYFIEGVTLSGLGGK